MHNFVTAPDTDDFIHRDWNVHMDWNVHRDWDVEATRPAELTS
jgi:hypothetical protein